MNETLPSLIILAALIAPAILFLNATAKPNAAKIVHALMMSALCLFMGFLLSAAVIKFSTVESQLIISTLIFVGSALAAITRLIWLRRYG